MRRRLLLPAIVAMMSATQVPSQSAGLVNGEVVPPQAVTALHQAVLVRPSETDGVVSRPTCSATVVTPTWVLTAAHCLQAPGLEVRAGSLRWDAGFTQHEITQVAIAPTQAMADLALLKVSPPVNDSGVPFASVSVPVGTAVRLSGWGLTRIDGPPSAALLSAVTSVTPEAGCPSLTRAELCLKDESGAGVSPCFGDSGGGVLAMGPSGYVLVGVVSRSGTASAACTGSAVAAATAPVAWWISSVLSGG